MPISACSNYLLMVNGTGYNKVAVPGPSSKGYTSITDQLLYEIWQTNLLIIAGLTPPGMTAPIIFTIGDGGPDTPAAGTTSLHAATLGGQSIANKTLVVFRNGFLLNYSTATDVNQIVRFNDGTDGGFDFTPASGLFFDTGEVYNIFILGINTTIEP